jgi:hypothetical protein
MADNVFDTGERVAIEKRVWCTWVTLPEVITVHNCAAILAGGSSVARLNR